MSSRGHIESTVKAFYAARVKGDVEATLENLAEDVVFGFNGRGMGVPALSDVIKGKAAVKTAASELIAAWKFSDWRICSLIVDGDRVAIHWKTSLTFVPNGKSETFDFFDHIVFSGGKIVDIRQNTDTAQALAMTAA